MFTFEIQWSYGAEWTRSGRRFPTIADAAEALATWLRVSAENGHCHPGRIVSA